jgi:hypothetical protein
MRKLKHDIMFLYMSFSIGLKYIFFCLTLFHFIIVNISHKAYYQKEQSFNSDDVNELPCCTFLVYMDVSIYSASFFLPYSQLI